MKTWREVQSELERDYFTSVLKTAKGNILQAAQISGCHRTEIYVRIKRHKINIEAMRSARGPVIPAPDTRKEFTVPVSYAERAVFAKYAQNAEFSGYAEFAEFAMFADQERVPGPFLTAVKEGLKCGT